MRLAGSDDPAPEVHPGIAWSRFHRIVFRFVFCYLGLYAISEGGSQYLLTAIPGAAWLIQPYFKMWRSLVGSVAIHIFHLSAAGIANLATSSGDTALDYVENLALAVLAVTATLLWSVTDRERGEYRRLEFWLSLVIRYTLAFTMFDYGFSKVFPLQFDPPVFSTLIERYGDFSPMGVLWKFMGASTAYTIFCGAGEVIGATLLLFRRTITFGALVLSAVLVNVVALNFCYDVPVKLYSLNLLFMAVFLLAPGLRQLIAVLVLNRPASPLERCAPQIREARLRLAIVVFQCVFVGHFLFREISESWDAYSKIHSHAQRPALYGLYDVEQFTRNGRDVPPLTTDATRWRRVAVENSASFIVQKMDDSIDSWEAGYDASTATLTLAASGEKSRHDSFSWSLPDADHAVIIGSLGNDALTIRLRRMDPARFPLLNRGFHWISEDVVNR